VISKPFKVIVDYAFTPNALEKVYQTLRNTRYGIPNTKLICVLGACGGGRDKWKRPVLGEIAAKYCDQIIITNEDPYDEDPYQILSMIKSGIFKSQFSISNFYEIIDRREAIRKSLQLAKPNDIVIITGKGCEPSIVIKGKKIPWDDRKTVREEFQKISVNQRTNQHQSASTI
jgi:UDP-N-acetylmuramoyl-L-alanyl-D-glutamate--2,6-diaminopimelate ligase